MDDKYKYTMKDFQKELGITRIAIIGRIKKLNVFSPDYFIKVKENNRDKIYYTQELFDLINYKKKRNR